ncbi:hypothetical protein [Ancylobacter sp. IITR112]|uniref:hypothetical protein n=1 Tax=Ancylobacter sp. IITR112 TaxID=3138073 RepID=UPI00352A291B
MTTPHRGGCRCRPVVFNATPPDPLNRLTRANEQRLRLALLRGLSVGRFIRRVEGGNG